MYFGVNIDFMIYFFQFLIYFNYFARIDILCA
jgi:hypothetical protein